MTKKKNIEKGSNTFSLQRRQENYVKLAQREHTVGENRLSAGISECCVDQRSHELPWSPAREPLHSKEAG